MDWSRKRQITIISGITIIILAIVAIFVYFKFIKHTPTCFDKIQNQDERGVDCGGICSLMCLTDVKPLIPLWTRPIKVAGDVYSVVAYIENQNTGNGVEKVPYEIRMYDDKNILINQPITGETFIGPNDRTAIFEGGIKVGNRVPKTAFLQFTQPLKFTRVDERFNDQNLVVENDTLTDVDTVPKLTAYITNKTLETFVNIPVVAILYDVNGNVLGSSQTFLESLGAEESLPVFFSWPEPFSAAVARREVVPRINPFIQSFIK